MQQYCLSSLLRAEVHPARPPTRQAPAPSPAPCGSLWAQQRQRSPSLDQVSHGIRIQLGAALTSPPSAASASIFGGRSEALEARGSFGEANPLSLVYNGQANTLTISLLNHGKSALSIDAISGAVREVGGKERHLANTTTAKYSLVLPPHSVTPVDVPYRFYSELRPQDVGFVVYVDYSDAADPKKTQLRTVAYDGSATIREPVGSWFDLQLCVSPRLPLVMLSPLLPSVLTSCFTCHAGQPPRLPALCPPPRRPSLPRLLDLYRAHALPQEQGRRRQPQEAPRLDCRRCELAHPTPEHPERPQRDRRRLDPRAPPHDQETHRQRQEPRRHGPRGRHPAQCYIGRRVRKRVGYRGKEERKERKRQGQGPVG